MMTRVHAVRSDKKLRRIGVACWGVGGLMWTAALFAQSAPFVPGRDDRAAPATVSSPLRADAPAAAFPQAESRYPAPESADRQLSADLPNAFPEINHPAAAQDPLPISKSPPAADLIRFRDHLDPEDYARAVALWPLSPIREQDMARVFSDACAHPDPQVSWNAREALRELPPDQVFAYVMRTLSWGGAGAVFAVDCLLPEIGPGIASLFRAVLENSTESERHRCVAAWALGRSGTTVAADLLCRYAIEAPSDLARCCREALKLMRPPEAAAVWIELLENRPEEAGPEAVAALDALGTFESAEWIFEAVCGRKSIGPYLEEEAVRCIARKPVMQAVPVLIAVLEQNRAMREVAAKALRQITGQPLGTDSGLWRAWYEQETGIVLPPLPPPPGNGAAGPVTPPPLEFPAERTPLMPIPDTGAGPVRRNPEADVGRASTPDTRPRPNPKSIRRKP